MPQPKTDTTRKLLREIKRLAKAKSVKAPKDAKGFLKWLNS